MTQQELAKIVENHQHWLNEDCEGWEGMRANLCCAGLSGMDLSGTDLTYADLSHSDLSYSDLTGTNLSGANLCGAHLGWADLTGANLFHAKLYGVPLDNADLTGAKNIPFIPYACPDTGSFIGYKKARGMIVELKILADALRCSATGRKCRCDKAKVLSIQHCDGSKSLLREIPSDHDATFIYRIGKIVTVDDFDNNRWRECAPGIHFFITRQEAVNHQN